MKEEKNGERWVFFLPFFPCLSLCFFAVVGERWNRRHAEKYSFPHKKLTKIIPFSPQKIQNFTKSELQQTIDEKKQTHLLRPRFLLYRAATSIRALETQKIMAFLCIWAIIIHTGKGGESASGINYCLYPRLVYAKFIKNEKGRRACRGFNILPHLVISLNFYATLSPPLQFDSPLVSDETKIRKIIHGSF